MTKKLLLVLVVLLILPFFAMASGAKEDSGKMTIAFCFQDLETEFWVAGHKAITETLTASGITVIEKNANEDANRQLEQVKTAITQGVDGIIIIPQDHSQSL